jgi:hypothetical protein
VNRSLTSSFRLVAVGLVCACAGTRTLDRRLLAPTSVPVRAAEQTTLKAHMRDGRVYVFESWTVDDAGRAVRGRAVQWDAARVQRGAADVSLAIDSIALIETDRVTGNRAVAALAVITAASVSLTMYCLANTKACFGSCPTFYAGDDGGKLLAEGFSSSVAPSLEARDIDALFLEKPASSRVDIAVRNEALETHVIRYVRLLAVPGPAGGHVLAGSDGKFWRTGAMRAPDLCRAAEGDCLGAVRARDGLERGSRADSTDLATRETIDLVFSGVPDGSRGVVLAMRQSLLSTYLFYQALAWMGSRAVGWLAALERAEPQTREQLGGVGRLLGGIEVQVPGPDGAWLTVDSIDETGPLAIDTHVVPIGAGTSDTVRVRLRLTRGHWRIDHVALAMLDGVAHPVLLEPESVRGAGGEDADARAALTDSSRTLVTMPGDEYVLSFRLPDGAGSYELFLDSRGYYLEWMREEWLREENPARAAALLLDPARALRWMAPEFKRIEASLDSVFWRSRYANR